MAFRCLACGNAKYQIEVAPEHRDKLVLSHNAHDELEVEIQGITRFVADLGFMNRFARCQHCGATQQWAYQFQPTITGA